jgi:hypothetical protein
MSLKPELEALLGTIHEKVAKHFLDLLDGGEISAAELGVLCKFLKDNGIDASAPPGSPLDQITKKLPFAPAEETLQ